ncbi:hypothetical protein L1887_31271 [Cichorium endivia]|nr:hypothetical protein L1887_31271 [Cichorium endivia]
MPTHSTQISDPFSHLVNPRPDLNLTLTRLSLSPFSLLRELSLTSPLLLLRSPSLPPTSHLPRSPSPASRLHTAAAAPPITATTSLLLSLPLSIANCNPPPSSSICSLPHRLNSPPPLPVRTTILTRTNRRRLLNLHLTSFSFSSATSLRPPARLHPVAAVSHLYLPISRSTASQTHETPPATAIFATQTTGSRPSVTGS